MPRLSQAPWLGVPLCLLLALSGTALAQTPGPQVPNKEKASFRLADSNLQVELVTSEPYLTSPVDMAWDANGRLYVAEITDYPTGNPTGRVVTFEDVDWNGTYDKFTVFADGLDLPTSVLPYRDGLLVMTARDITYLIDADRDGISEKREVVLTGLEGGHPLLRPGSLQWGIDNWVYASHGGKGELHRPQDPKSKGVSVDGRDFRFLPDGSKVDPLTGASSAGLAMDTYGARFPSSAIEPLQHVVLEERYFTRNPQLAPQVSVVGILNPDESKHLSPRTSPATTPIRAGRGIHFFRGNGLPTRYINNLFLADPVANVVHRRRLDPEHATFVAHRTDERGEFLSSTDPWFRPVCIETGPDGALYVLDFYRAAYEYPEIDRAKARASVALAHGTDKGRLWRIRPVERAGRARLGTMKRPQLTSASNSELVQMLGHENGWWRETAQRLLLERNAQDAVPALRAIFNDQRNAKARLHALWVLEGLNAVDDRTLIIALSDVYPGLRSSALRLAEPRIAKSNEIRAAVLGVIADADPRVRLELAATLGDVTGEDVTNVLATIALENADDRWVRRTLLGALGRDPVTFLEKLLDKNPQWMNAPTVGQMLVLAEFAEMIGYRNQPAELTRVLKRAAPAAGGPTLRGQRALFTGLAEGLARTGHPLHTLRRELPTMGANAAHVDKLFAAARELAEARSADTRQRVDAIRLMAEDDPAAAGPVLVKLASGAQPPAVQAAAVWALATSGDRSQIETLFSAWAELSPAARREAVAALLRTPATRPVLIAALEAQRIPLADLEPLAVAALQHLPDASEQSRVAKLLTATTDVDRAALIASYAKEVGTLDAPANSGGRRPLIQATVSDERGASLFAQNCLSCHRISGHGSTTGSDLAVAAALPREVFLARLLDPNRAALPSQRGSIIVTKSGQLLYGAIGLETSQAMSLRRADGTELTIPRSEIAAVHATEHALMPAGFEALLSPADVADLLAFVTRPRLELLPAEVRVVVEDAAVKPIESKAPVKETAPASAP
ncbi:MAG: c-type cytochrome [Pirellulales bacterium]|nr:c-type cytochrome [Pirellulales bacterium]